MAVVVVPCIDGLMHDAWRAADHVAPVGDESKAMVIGGIF